LGFILMIALPLFAAVVWGTFNVQAIQPFGKSARALPGIVRLLIELDIFGCATWALFSLNPTNGWVFASSCGYITICSYDRIAGCSNR